MASYRATLTTAKPQDEVFAYLSEFSNAREWDPGVTDAARVDGGELGVGSNFRLDFKVGPTTSRFEYRIVEFDAPRTVVLIGETPTLVSRDRIDVDPAGTGSRVTYDAQLTLKGPLKAVDRLLQLGFTRAGDRALDGLRTVLGRAVLEG